MYDRFSVGKERCMDHVKDRSVAVHKAKSMEMWIEMRKEGIWVARIRSERSRER